MMSPGTQGKWNWPWSSRPTHSSDEPLAYRQHLFDEFVSVASLATLRGKRALEIGPKDGLDTRRLASLEPAELVLIDLPEKHATTSAWLPQIPGRCRLVEANLMYMASAELAALGTFDVAWCTGVLYHNAEQLRLLRRLYRLLNDGGYLVLESATLRGPRALREGCYVEIHFPRTYRDTGTITHLPSAGAIRAWLQMAGFREIRDSRCFEAENRDLMGQRMACICRKSGGDEGGAYYAKSGANPLYRLGEAT